MRFILVMLAVLAAGSEVWADFDAVPFADVRATSEVNLGREGFGAFQVENNWLAGLVFDGSLVPLTESSAVLDPPPSNVVRVRGTTSPLGPDGQRITLSFFGPSADADPPQDDLPILLDLTGEHTTPVFDPNTPSDPNDPNDPNDPGAPVRGPVNLFDVGLMNLGWAGIDPRDVYIDLRNAQARIVKTDGSEQVLSFGKFPYQIDTPRIGGASILVSLNSSAPLRPPYVPALLDSADEVHLTFDVFLCPRSGTVLHVPADFATIQAAIGAAVDGDEVLVEPGVYTEHLRLNGKAITLYGSGVDPNTGLADPNQVTLDGGNTNRVLELVDGETPCTVIKNVRIRAGAAADGGGALLDGSAPVFRACRFVRNNATGRGGGLFATNTASVLHVDCAFVANTAGEQGGGAFAGANSIAVLLDCVFDRNLADSGGAGLRAGAGSILLAFGSTFSQNRVLVAGNGGAFLCGDDSQTEIRASDFRRNRALSGGAGHVGARSRMIVSDTTHARNRSQSPGMGGCWFIDSATIADVYGCRFENNLGIGSALFARQAILSVTDCGFFANRVSVVMGDSVSLSIRACEFTDNVVDGGVPDGTVLTSGDVEIRDSRFLRNARALNLTGTVHVADCEIQESQWAGIEIISGQVVIERSAFRQTDGFGVLNQGQSETTIRQCVFEENVAGVEKGGAGIYNRQIEAPPNAESNVHIIDCRFERNDSFQGGAVRNVSVGGDRVLSVFLSGCTFLDNIGGVSAAVYNTDTNLRIDNTWFQHNLASVGGGAINVGSSRGRTIEILRSTFIENATQVFSNSGGGAVFLVPAKHTLVSECNFIGNSSEGPGGAISFYNGQRPRSVRDCSFSGNQSTGEGGAIYSERFSGLVVGCRFLDNRALDGAAVALGEADILGCVFAQNVATVSGGALRALGPVRVVNAMFIGNSAGQFGGAIQNEANETTCATNCTFYMNTAGQSGDIAFNAIRTRTGILNSVVSGNGQSLFAGPGATSCQFSLVEGGHPGPGNIDADPLFVDPLGADGIAGTVDDDLRLLPGSPGIDAGNDFLVPPDSFDLDGDGDVDEPTPVDFDGNQRFIDDPNAAAVCDADLDGDGQVGLSDLMVLLANFGRVGASPSDGDLTGDGRVSLSDLAELLAQFGCGGTVDMGAFEFQG